MKTTALFLSLFGTLVIYYDETVPLDRLNALARMDGLSGYTAESVILAKNKLPCPYSLESTTPKDSEAEAVAETP